MTLWQPVKSIHFWISENKSSPWSDIYFSSLSYWRNNSNLNKMFADDCFRFSFNIFSYSSFFIHSAFKRFPFWTHWSIPTLLDSHHHVLLYGQYFGGYTCLLSLSRHKQHLYKGALISFHQTKWNTTNMHQFSPGCF